MKVYHSSVIWLTAGNILNQDEWANAPSYYYEHCRIPVINLKHVIWKPRTKTE